MIGLRPDDRRNSIRFNGAEAIELPKRRTVRAQGAASATFRKDATSFRV